MRTFACTIRRHPARLGQVIDERLGGGRLAVLQLRQQRLGLTAKMVEMGPGRKLLVHKSSMHLGSAIRLHEGSCV